AQEWDCESCVTAPIAPTAQSIFIRNLVIRRLFVVCQKKKGVRPKEVQLPASATSLHPNNKISSERPAMNNVIIVDDHPLVREALIQLIRRQPDLNCIGTAETTAEARRMVETLSPHLLILDLRLKSGDALDLIKTLRAEHPELKVLVLSQYDE